MDACPQYLIAHPEHHAKQILNIIAEMAEHNLTSVENLWASKPARPVQKSDDQADRLVQSQLCTSPFSPPVSCFKCHKV